MSNSNNTYYIYCAESLLPRKANELDAGYDIYADIRSLGLQPGSYKFDPKEQYFTDWEGNVVIFPQGHFICPTGIYIAPREPFLNLDNVLGQNLESYSFLKEIQIRAKSGLASQGLMVTNGIGTIDSGYIGELGVCLYNSSPFPLVIRQGQKIAQIVSTSTLPTTFSQVKDYNELKNLAFRDGRGEGGFGSTGV